MSKRSENNNNNIKETVLCHEVYAMKLLNCKCSFEEPDMLNLYEHKSEI